MARRDKAAERRTALDRIDRLMGRARAEALGPDPDLADRYADLARRVAMKYQVPLPRPHKAALCRRCGAYRVPGRTARTRLQRGRLVTTCLRCGEVRRRPLHPAARPVRPAARAPMPDASPAGDAAPRPPHPRNLP